MLTIEKQKLNQKLKILFEENRALKELAKMPLDDKIARSVAERELAKEKRNNNKKKYFEYKKNTKQKDIGMKLVARKVKRMNTRSIENLKQEKKRLSARKAKARRMRKKKSLIERRKRRLTKKANKVSEYIQKK